MLIQLLRFQFLIPILIITGIIYLSIKVAREYERCLVFRMGRLKGLRGPGLFFIFPIIDKVIKVDTRIISIDVPKQEIMTRDNVPVTIDAVIYFKIDDPVKAIINVVNYYQSTFLIAQTTLRSILGRVDLDELLSQKEKINQQLRDVIDKQTEPWGVKVPLVEIKEVTLPESMKRAMAKQAETERERRAKIIDAEGEFQAAEKLAQAAEILSRNSAAIQLRYLQILREISIEKNSTTIFPVPIDLFSAFLKNK